MGIRVRADTREGLLRPAAAGLYAAFGELSPTQTGATSFAFHTEGHDDAVLLRDFLTELLVLFEREHRILTTIESSSFSGGKLVVSGSTAEVDLGQCVFCREVKAITYHGLNICKLDDGYEATLIVDI